jgi:pyruvate formate lyase activating enzyme
MWTYFLYDLKHMDSGRHEKLTGVPNELILKNAKVIQIWRQVSDSLSVVPKLNDSPENIRATPNFCVSIKNAVDVVSCCPTTRWAR